MADRSIAPPVTRAYAEAARQRAYGHTVYRCPTCGLEAWGGAVTMHEHQHRDHLGMVPLDTLVERPSSEALEARALSVALDVLYTAMGGRLGVTRG
jgi:hypothetical protein